MNKFLLFFQKRLLPNFLVILYAGVSVAIASAAAYKLSQPLLQTKEERTGNTLPAKTEINTEPMDSEETDDFANPLANIDFIESFPNILDITSIEDENQSTLSQNSSTQSLSNSPRNNNQNNNLAAANTNPTGNNNNNSSATVSTSLAASNSSACIITLFGKQYDVTPLIQAHPGGNVFQCGTDQTVLYTSQHGTNVKRMQPYLVTTSLASSSTNNSTTIGNANNTTARWEEDDERDDFSEFDDD